MNFELTVSGFNKLVKRLADEVRTGVSRQLKRKKWQQAVFDARWYPEGAIYTSKLNATLESGETVIIDPPDGIADFMFSLDDMRNGVFPEPWYGILLNVQVNGKFDWSFNHNPDCASDSDFLKSP